jgi:phosphoribosyl-AMP cyclohydrolase / phosphoribosyl-ATP pyrophosphohydrolase
MDYKKIIPYINAENELPVNVINLAEKYSFNGADELFIYNYSKDEQSRDEFLLMIKQIARVVDIPFMVGLYVKRLEDIKKTLYTGASHVVIKQVLIEDEDAIKEAISRFGKDKIVIEIDSLEAFKDMEYSSHLKELGIYAILLKHVILSDTLTENISNTLIPIIIRDSLVRNDLSDLLLTDNIIGVSTNAFKNKDIMKAKLALKKENIKVNSYESTMKFSDFKINIDGLITVVTQDYKTNDVLMVAYMNEEAFNQTVETGKMTYWSRSRNELWCKGDTSGHYQYVKNLKIDCDNDTILAKVRQIGAACHTGNKSCFFRDLVKREFDATNPLTVFNDVFDVIMDRKNNPKEGSYTNYLFDKGIDKILKKCGEEATEIVIAAKNPDEEELKYEIADFLYHMMVLMAECDLDWNDVVKELAHRS